MLDRGVHKTLVIEGKGADFPFDGGTADITSRCCCSAFGWELPRVRRTGNAGVVRDLIEGADLAIANFENPAPDNHRYHARGTVFSADPRLIEGLADAGIDYVSLANNHIRDAGAAGLLQTIANITKHDIAVSGGGQGPGGGPQAGDARGGRKRSRSSLRRDRRATTTRPPTRQAVRP